MALFRDIDTIEELAHILASNVDDLSDFSRGERDVLVVNAFDDELVLDVGGEGDGAAGEEVDLLDLFSADEVLDLDGTLVLGDGGVDGEMGVDQSHLVLETLSDPDDHVSDVGGAGLNATLLLVAAEPLFKADDLLLFLVLGNLNVGGHVTEALHDLTQGSLHSHLAGLGAHSHYRVKSTHTYRQRESLPLLECSDISSLLP